MKGHVMLKRFLLALAVVVLVPMVAGAELKIHKTTLDNGMNVVVAEEHSAPVVSVQMWVKVGSADETEEVAGLSHVFEHMLFKGTERRGVGELARAVESVGGNINAYTSFDNTVYFLTVPSRYSTTGLDVISDAIQNSSFDPGELEKELQVVLEEIRMGEDSPGRNLYRSVLSTAYTTHPYRRPVIGYKEVIEGLEREDLLELYRKWYVPSNMNLIVVGDVDHEEVMKEVRKMFASFDRTGSPGKNRPTEPPQEELRVEVFSKEVQAGRFGMAFHIPNIQHPDTYALDVLANILSAGQTSRLKKKLKLEENLVHGISTYPMSLKNPGIFFITSTLDSDKVERVVPEVVKIIKRLGAEGPSAEELDRAKLKLESGFVYSRETMQGIARKLGYYLTVAGDLEYEQKYIDAIRGVTAEDIKRVVEEYFTSENMSVSVLLPDEDKKAVTEKGVRRLVKAAFKESKTFAAEDDETPETTKLVLSNGATLIVKEVRSNPVVAFHAAFPGGLRYEDPENNGISSFVAGMLKRGTTSRTREELAEEVEGMAGHMGGFSGWNATGASGRFLSRYFDRGLEVFSDMLKNPSFPEQEIEKFKQDRVAAIKRQEEYLPGYTFKLLKEELFGGHPYGMKGIGTIENVEAFTGDDLRQWYSRTFVPERMVLTIVGDVDAEYARARAEELLGGFTREAPGLTPPAPASRPEAITKVGETKDKEQTHVGIGFLGATLKDEDRFALNVLSEVLSGQGGRLFLNLRDKKSLAYSVTAFTRTGLDPGMFGTYIGCAPEKTDEAIKGMLAELKRVTEEKITEEELERAKNSIIGGFEIGLQKVASQASTMTMHELHGLGYDFGREYPEKINAVTREDVLEAARKYITLDAYTLSVVGPSWPID